MLISIVIPVYNVELYLKDCLNSILNQDCELTDCEIICINDGSSDNSLNILQEYKDKNKNIEFIIINQVNKGQAAARNCGLRIAKGEYILFIDSDDWITSNTISTLRNAIRDNQTCDLICFNGKLFYQDKNGVEKYDLGFTKEYNNGVQYFEDNISKPLVFNFVCVVLRLYKNQFFKDNNLLFYEGIYHEDNLFSIEVCFKAQKIKVIPDNLYIYRIRSGSTMTKPNIKKINDILTVCNELQKLPTNKTLYTYIANTYLGLFSRNYNNIYGNIDEHLTKKIDFENLKKLASESIKSTFNYYLLKISPATLRNFTYYEGEIKKGIRKIKRLILKTA